MIKDECYARLLLIPLKISQYVYFLPVKWKIMLNVSVLLYIFNIFHIVIHNLNSCIPQFTPTFPHRFKH